MKKCTVSGRCGGCKYLEIPYEQQLIDKKKYIESLFPGHVVAPVLGMDDPYFYRCKVQMAVRQEKGRPVGGNYEEKSHRLVAVEDCVINDKECHKLALDVIRLAGKFHLSVFDEHTGQGLLRHVLIRKGFKTGQLMVVLVTGNAVFPGRNNFKKALIKLHPEITTIIQNINDKFGSMVLGSKNIVLYGSGSIMDQMEDKKFLISAGSFYQINPPQAERLYSLAIKMAKETGESNELSGKTLLDAYCGTGTIGILASKYFSKVIGVELNEGAVRDARKNASINHVTNISFEAGDAGKYLISHSVPDIVILDPPRSGSSLEFLNALIQSMPERIVYISCGPDTQARDCKILTNAGYHIDKICPVDLFPFTAHCECVVLMSRKDTCKR